MTDTRDSFVNVKPVIVADAPEAHQVWLDIGVQHFTVGDYCETKEEADWHANQLRHALLSASPGERDGDAERLNWLANGGWEVMQDPIMWPPNLNFREAIDHGRVVVRVDAIGQAIAGESHDR